MKDVPIILVVRWREAAIGKAPMKPLTRTAVGFLVAETEEMFVITPEITSEETAGGFLTVPRNAVLDATRLHMKPPPSEDGPTLPKPEDWGW